MIEPQEVKLTIRLAVHFSRVLDIVVRASSLDRTQRLEGLVEGLIKVGKAEVMGRLNTD